MTQFYQPNIPEMDKELARIQREEIGEETTQMHLARQYIKYGKWAKFSKDPEFIKRCNSWREQVVKLMSKGHYEK